MAKRNDIKLGTHGEDYGNWMSTPVFYVFGGLAALALILAVVSFALLHISVITAGERFWMWAAAPGRSRYARP